MGRFVIYVTNTRYSGKICCICYKHKVQWEDLLFMLQTQGTVGRFVIYVTNTRYNGKIQTLSTGTENMSAGVVGIFINI